MSHTYEVEIKSLLGTRDRADVFRRLLNEKFPQTRFLGRGKQLNHYFNTPIDLANLAKAIKPLIKGGELASLDKIIAEGKKISIRTRDADGDVIFVMKASVGDDSSSNGVKRIEFEAVVPLSLDTLDKFLIDAGCSYQAKWSREREEYKSGDIAICLDKNAGYGYVVEFEMVVKDESSLDKVKSELLRFMKECGVVELPQDRLERMFAYYNTHWNEYYGTDKTFIIE